MVEERSQINNTKWNNAYSGSARLELNTEFSKLEIPHDHKILLQSDHESVGDTHGLNRLSWAGVYAWVELFGKAIYFLPNNQIVGILRSTEGNMPNILHRLLVHRGAIYSVINMGLAKSYQANPVASLRVEQLYGLPGLLSGLGAWVLSQSELEIIDNHHRNMLRNILKLYYKTPAPVIYFLAGSLPAFAFLRLRQLSLLRMIRRKPGSVHYQHALALYASGNKSSHSWFVQVSNLFYMYKIHHPIQILKQPKLFLFSWNN